MRCAVGITKRAGQPLRFACTCGFSFGGACEHAVAVMIACNQQQAQQQSLDLSAAPVSTEIPAHGSHANNITEIREHPVGRLYLSEYDGFLFIEIRYAYFNSTIEFARTDSDPYRLVPGDMGTIVYLHGILYAEEYGFDQTFEPYVAVPLADFVRSRGDRDRIWIVETNEKMVGTVAILSVSQEVAQLRWLLVHPDARGTGLGKRLVREAIDFCKTCKYRSVFLWTLNILPKAAYLYRSAGFKKTEAKAHHIWGCDLTEERYELFL